MATVLVSMIVTFGLLFGGMMILGVLAAHPWIIVIAIAYALWKGEIEPWLSSRTT